MLLYIKLFDNYEFILIKIITELIGFGITFVKIIKRGVNKIT